MCIPRFWVLFLGWKKGIVNTLESDQYNGEGRSQRGKWITTIIKDKWLEHRNTLLIYSIE